MRYNVNDPYFKTFKVELNGEIQSNVVEADDVEGWVKTEKAVGGWGRSWSEKKTKYGRVFIIRFPELEEESESAEEKASED